MGRACRPSLERGPQVTPDQVCSPLQLPCRWWSVYNKDNVYAPPMGMAWPRPVSGAALTPGPREASASLLPLFCRHLQEPPWPNPILFMRRQRKQLLLFCLSLSTPGPH